ncbi:tetratricopeptide repeat protein [uncultured Piscinibacter sp.]|uniref:ATP-binding protein n=1 Tax=uncultured Piscinibacter sp. TaxID=1131835 RepID=UPI00260234C8|nr:tetratricopeptide repeat protein [uncultured Piscinibacter sp.]
MRFDYVMGPVSIRPNERCVYVHGQPLALGARAFDLLLALVERRDRVVGKEELLALVWPGAVVEEGNLSVQVSTLRKALGEKVISTVPGRGYRFTAQVVEQAPSGAPPAEVRGPAAAALPVPGPEAGRGGWLPAAMTPLLGRAAALAETQALLPTTRCLTLVGAGGAGKTRLALALADAVRSHYPGGVWWIGLDALSDPVLLPQVVAGAVGGTDLRTPPVALLKKRLAGRATLLVVDNCEHLVEACADLAVRLLRELPQLQLLATSRESLRIAGEVVWSVPPLDVPDAADPAGAGTARLGALAQVPSVQLLVERIRQHNTGFALAPDNAVPLAQICRGLEGLPLALELVAAQVGPRTLAQVAARLDRSLGLLNVGTRGGMHHHQTMAAAIDWGFRLLGEPDQSVFLRLSIFLGGWTLESAAAACEDLELGAEPLADVMGRLLRASMVLARPTAAPPDSLRFRMLEPIRQFGLAQLEEQGQVDAVKQQVLHWYGVRGKRLAAQLGGPQQAAGYADLAAEFDNLRALLSWSRHHDLASGMQLASDLWRFWQVQGHAQEMLDWFDEVLPQAETRALPERLRAEASNAAGTMARTCGQYDKARSLYEAALALQRRLGSRRGEAIVLNNLCLIARDRYDHAAVLQQGSTSLALAREIGDRNLEGLALMHLGTALRGLDRPADAEASFRQSLEIFVALGEQRAQGALRNFLGNLALAEGRWSEAERAFQEGLALNQTLQDFWGLGISSCNLATLQAARGDDGAARELLLRSLAHYRRSGARHGVEECFELLARLERRRGEWLRAAWCWGVVERLERDMGKQLPTALQARRDAEISAFKGALPEAEFRTAHTQGQQVALADAFATVLSHAGSSPARQPH